MEVARAAAVAEAKRRGWLAPNEAAPPEEPTTGASGLIALLARPHLRRLRGEPSPGRESAAEEERRRSEVEARKKAERYARIDRVMAKAGRG